MSDFVVSARKYRPSNFATVVGQNSITQTLENAISNDQVAHAYLFCGPRGVGKTSCARIFAKAINQESVDDDRDFEFNIFELDAASNNKVDDIRQLIDQVRIQPQVGNYKVYIIDEVHMLSKNAFNAFLKTLEEPPKHAIFILATTEKHKILPTILSRCQIYDFNRISTEDIAKHLAFIAQQEGVTADEEALYLVAQKADGALRDALSIFDQIVSFNGKNVTYERVLENLNILDHDHFFQMTEFIRTNDRAQIFLSIEKIMSSGFELSHFSSGFSQHLRDLLVCKDQSTVQLLEVSQRVKNRFIERSSSIEEKYLLNALHFMNEAEVRLKNSTNQRLLLELTLLKIANLFGKPVEKKSPELIPIDEKEIPKIDVKERPDLEIIDPQKVAPEVVEPDNAIDNDKVEKDGVKSEKEILEQSSLIDEVQEPKNVKGDPGLGVISVQKAEEFIAKEDIVKAPKKTSLIRSSSSISLGIGMNAAEPEELYGQKTSTTDTPEIIENLDEVSQDALVASWKIFASKLKEEGKYNLHATLMSKDPSMDKNEIHFVLENKMQQEALNEVKMELLLHLRSELKNDTLIFDHSITDSKTMLPESGPVEKFNKMSEKNPTLKDLKEQMDLGLE